MKKGFYLFAALLLLTCSSSQAQSFNLGADTIFFSTDSYYTLLNNVTNNTSANITLQWHEVGNNFPLPLQLTTCLCDNFRCNHDSTFFIGGHYESDYPSGHGEMHLMGDISGFSDAGPFYLSLRFNNKDVPGDADTTTFVISRLPPLGISSMFASGNIGVFPNPAKDKATICIQMGKNEQAQIGIVDMSGRSVYTSSQFLQAGENSIIVPLETVVPGLYNVVISAGNHISSRKLTIAR